MADDTKAKKEWSLVSSWASMFRTARMAVGVVAVTALGLLVLPQFRDMLAGISDYSTGYAQAIAFHLSLFVLAFCAWFWPRTVLAARFRVRDEDRKTGVRDNQKFDAKAFEYTPRLLFLTVAFAGLGAAIDSGDWSDAIVIFLWSSALFAALTKRLKIQDAFGLRLQMAEPAPEDRKPATFRSTLDNLKYFSPFGPWPVRVLLLAGIALFAVSVVGTFFAAVDSAAWIAFFAQALPGPSILFLALALAIGPMTFLTYRFDTTPVTVNLYGLKLLLFNRAPVLLIVTGLALIGPVAVPLNVIRIMPPSPERISPGQRVSLETALKDWRDKCGGGSSGGAMRPVIVAVSGGATRASLWAGRVLMEVDKELKGKHSSIFAISSVSGGSYGAAAFVTLISGQDRGCHLTLPLADAPIAAQQAATDRDEALKRALGGDELAAALSGTLLADVPRGIFGILAFGLNRFVASLCTRSGNAATDTAMRGGDRAEALERAFERNWKAVKAVSGSKETLDFDNAFLRLFYTGGGKDQGPVYRGDVPIWIANGADVLSGDRIVTTPVAIDDICLPATPPPTLPADEIVSPGTSEKCAPALSAISTTPSAPPPSPVQLGSASVPGQTPAALPQRRKITVFHGARDLLGILNADVRISTAIVNTARFPYLSPPGELTPVGPKNQRNSLQVVDGGYFENEGVRTAMELADRLTLLDSNIKPIIVEATADADDDIKERQIERCNNAFHDNPENGRGGSRPSQLSAPLIGLLTSRGGASHVALREALDRYCGPDNADPAFFHFYLYQMPHGEIPLNWVVSPAVADYIWDEEFALAGNAEELERMRKVFKSLQ